ncbi:MAG: hypothetical protein Q9211_002356 [Gyalolechia sp. 1 TL-2023]
MLFPFLSSTVHLLVSLLLLLIISPTAISGLALLATDQSTTPASQTKPHPNAATFRITVARAVQRIQRSWPGASLHRIELKSRTGPIRNPLLLVDVRLFFALPAGNLHPPSLLLASQTDATEWGQWSPPQYLRDARPEAEMGLGDVLTSDILQAVEAMRRDRQVGRFRACDVVREEGMTEVWWQFQMAGLSDIGWILVGDVSGMVEVERLLRGGRCNELLQHCTAGTRN